jgi:hypothetical protein
MDAPKAILARRSVREYPTRPPPADRYREDRVHRNAW